MLLLLVLMMVVVRRHGRGVSGRMLHRWLLLLRNVALRSPLLLEIFTARSWRYLWLLSWKKLLLLLRRSYLQRLLLLWRSDLSRLLHLLPRNRPRRGYLLIRTHHVRGLEARLRRRLLRLMARGIVVRRERRDERLLRLRVGVVARPSRRSIRRRGLLVEIPGGGAGPGDGPAPGSTRGQLVAVLINVADGGLLAVVVAEVVHEAALLQPLLHHLVHEAVVADEAALVLALVVARGPRALEGVAAGRESLAEPLAVVAVGEVAEEHVAPREVALAQGTALSVAVGRLVLLDEGNSIKHSRQCISTCK